MTHYVIELIIWMLVAFFIGCLIGWILRSLFGKREEPAATYTPPQPVAKPAESLAAKPATPVAPIAPAPIAPVAAPATPAPVASAPVASAPAASPAAPAAAPPPRPIEPTVLNPLPVSAVPGASPRMERPKGIDAARGGKADNLQMISGVGPKNEQILNTLGFFHFDQIAAWTPAQVAWVDDHLKFGGRVEREDWITQARLLAAGNYAEFRRRFGTGGLSEAEFDRLTGTGKPAAAPAAPLASATAPSTSSPATAVKPVAAEPAKPAAPAPAKPAAPVAAAPAKPAAVDTSAAPHMERPRGLDTARGGKADNLQMISGVGPKNEQILHNLGIYHFDQIAAWTPAQIAWVDDHLKFGGRIEREDWITQARLLATGDYAEFRRQFGTGGMTEAEFERAAKGESGTGRPSSSAKPAAAEPVAKPAPVAAPAPAPAKASPSRAEPPKGIDKARGGKPDNLQRISGVGPKNEKILHSLGFFHFDQIAGWTAQQVKWVDEHLKFGGRIEREEWVAQCKLLAAGKEEEFARKWGTGGLKPEKKK